MGGFSSLGKYFAKRSPSFPLGRTKTDESIESIFPFSLVRLKISAKKRGLAEFIESQQGMRNATGLLFGMLASKSTPPW